MNQAPKSRLGNRKVAVVVAILVSVALAGIYFGIAFFNQSPCPSVVTLRSFVIIANDTTGYNGSRNQPFTMSVQEGDCVLVTFVNNSTNQSHGLAIDYYYPNGIVAQAKSIESARFQANKPGQFRVFENLFSTIAPWTNNAGTLNVI